MSQLDPIIAILKRDGEISNFYAIENKLTLRLAARVKDLRNKGWEIHTDKMPDKNCIYHLVAEPAPKQLTI